MYNKRLFSLAKQKLLGPAKLVNFASVPQNCILRAALRDKTRTDFNTLQILTI